MWDLVPWPGIEGGLPALDSLQSLSHWTSREVPPTGLLTPNVGCCLLIHLMVSYIKKQRHYFANKGLSSQSYGFSSSHVWMWELYYKESWEPKNWCFWTVVLKTLESPLDCKEIQPVHPKGDQSWVFIGRTDVEWGWNSNTLATWCKQLTHWKRPWCWGRLRAGGEGDDRGWDGWMASPTQCM